MPLKFAEKRRRSLITGIDRTGKLAAMLKYGLDTVREPFGIIVSNMLDGKCPKCGTRYFGWALRFPRHQTCPKCGVGLDIIEDGKQVSKGYSPFTAEKHSVDAGAGTPSFKDKKQETSVPKKGSHS